MMNPRRSFLERAVVAAMVVAIHSYRIVIAPFWIGGCRHIPTCSRYAVEALQLHGIKKGTKLALKRIMRCRPRGTWGYDPVEHVK